MALPQTYKTSQLKTVLICLYLTLVLLTWTIWRAPTNDSKWQMGFNSAFKGLSDHLKPNLDVRLHSKQKFFYHVLTVKGR